MQSVQTYLPLSQAEAEMQKALTAYFGAEERLQQSQASVDEAVRLLQEARLKHQTRRREYDKALEALNACQSEMEVSFAALQESSPQSSMWQRSERIAERTAALGLRSSSDDALIETPAYVVATDDTINIVSR